VTFRLLGTTVRVNPGFWVVHVLIGAILASTGDPLAFFIWVGGAFISIMIHELGHVLTGRAFGAEGEIVLTVLGGLAVGSTDLHDRWKRIIVLLAGPLAQAALGGLLWLASHLVLRSLSVESKYFIPVAMNFSMLVGINLGWPLINMLPIPPLDGGKIAQEVVQGLLSRGRPPWEQDPNWWKRR
jgi:Zn-dependent protease